MQVASENLTFYAGDLVLDQFVATDELRMPILNKLPSSVFRVLTMKLGMRVPRRTYGRTWPDQPSRGPIGRMRVGQLFDSIDAEHNTETEVSSEGVDLMRIGLAMSSPTRSQYFQRAQTLSLCASFSQESNSNLASCFR